MFKAALAHSPFAAYRTHSYHNKHIYAKKFIPGFLVVELSGFLVVELSGSLEKWYQESTTNKYFDMMATS